MHEVDAFILAYLISKRKEPSPPLHQKLHPRMPGSQQEVGPFAGAGCQRLLHSE
jgi:hypothetical protein